MKHVRLNEQNRRAIYSAVIKHRFSTDINEITSRYAEVASAVLLRTFDQEQLSLLNSLPEGWCDTKNGIDLQVGGQHHFIRFDGAIYWDRHTRIREWDNSCYQEGPKSRPMPHHYKPLTITASDVLAKQLAKLEQDKSKLQEAFAGVSKQVSTMLGTYGTTKTLLEAWPEIEPFLPKKAQTIVQPVRLPAISIPSLNSMLRLPVDQADATNVVKFAS